MQHHDTTTRRTFVRQTTAAVGAATLLGAGAGSAAAQSEPDYGGWFDGVSNFEGTYDFTGQSEVTVQVGAAGNGGNFAFSPPAIRVDPDTTVVWEWTGKGASHNVLDESGVTLESDLVAEAGHTYEKTFESEGMTKYFCQPHRSLGMKGAVVVGGSGGLDPAQLEESGGGGGGGGNQTGGNQTGGNQTGGGGGGTGGGFDPSIGLATVGAALFIALLSPFFFAALLLFEGVDAEPPETPTLRED